MKLAIQCDFDGTITVGEVSHLLLNEFAGDGWKSVVDDFYHGGMSVTECMKRCFSFIKADERTMKEFILSDGLVKVRDGFSEFHSYCTGHGYYFSIVSNGLVFYIDAILDRLGLNNIDVIAGKSCPGPDGMILEYDGPESAFKESSTEGLKAKGYSVVCIGDSVTDVPVARRAQYVFATDALQELCRREGIEYIPFDDFYDVIKGLEKLAGVR